MKNQTTTYSRGAALLIGAIVLGTVSVAGAYEAGSVAGGGSIKGVVKFKGTPPAATVVEVNKDKAVCAVTEKMAKELVVAADGGIQYAVVSISNIATGKAFSEDAALLDQAGCEYLPHVVVVPTGQDLTIKNSDGILHNIHTYSEKNKPVNRAQPKFKKKITEQFAEPEMVKVTCDVHGWMVGWLAVSDHPYTVVTEASGAFELTDVPAGDYEIKVWQEKLGEATQTVSVAAGAEATANFELAE